MGYDYLREAMRLFRVDRVLEAAPLEATFERPPGYDAPERVLDALAAMPHDRWSVEVILEVTLEVACEQVPVLGIVLEETPNMGVVLRSSTSE